MLLGQLGGVRWSSCKTKRTKWVQYICIYIYHDHRTVKERDPKKKETLLAPGNESGKAEGLAAQAEHHNSRGNIKRQQ